MCGDADAHVVLAVTHTLFRSLLVDTRHVASTHDAPHLHSLTLLYAIDVRGELHDALHFRPVILLYVTSVRQLHCNTIDVRGELSSCSVYTLRYDIQFYLAVVQLDKTRILFLALASPACDDTASLQ